jgi:hypothetical protein
MHRPSIKILAGTSVRDDHRHTLARNLFLAIPFDACARIGIRDSRLSINAYRGRGIAQLCVHLRPDLVHEFRRN